MCVIVYACGMSACSNWHVYACVLVGGYIRLMYPYHFIDKRAWNLPAEYFTVIKVFV